MSDFEEKYVYTYPKQPLFWKRYLDNCVLVWLHGEEELQKFLAHLNACHPTIKFTMEWSLDKINFLDTTLHKDHDGTLWTDLYCKSTDSHSYLHYTSAHLSHCKCSLPFSQFLRVRRICSHNSDFLRHSMMLLC